ncbi:hypothetical protein IE53DRAFT_366728 [Violaceomyces palustris]|uniref:Uncharacterized protein n=1 Tax=Violaceomyces palustris TaxID=1673888 RepID=A0ACD0P4R2_9BASI|nr:hypothetical protein IE53DRAFT_366728 [Violaceomyces palustris]
MAKSKGGRLTRADRRQRDPDPIIQLPSEDQPPSTSKQPLPRTSTFQPPPPQGVGKKAGTRQRGQKSQKLSREKREKAVELADKLANKSRVNTERSEKKKRAKADV